MLLVYQFHAKGGTFTCGLYIPVAGKFSKGILLWKIICLQKLEVNQRSEHNMRQTIYLIIFMFLKKYFAVN